MSGTTQKTCWSLKSRAYTFLKQSGFLIPTASHHGGLKGGFDLSPFTAVLKRNLENYWWRSVVHSSPNCYAYESPILTPTNVLKASGHVDKFCDTVVTDLLCGSRVRVDHASPLVVSSLPSGSKSIKIHAPDKSVAKAWRAVIRDKLAPGIKLDVINNTDIQVYLTSDQAAGSLCFVPHDTSHRPVEIKFHGITNPRSNNPFLSAPATVNLLLKSYTDPTDPIDRCMHLSAAPKSEIEQSLSPVYLRPETAQGIYSQFPHLIKTFPYMKPPFGLAQSGKSFRNEIRPEHYLFRSLEFEQLELQYFVAPEHAHAAHANWVDQRILWWRSITNQENEFRLQVHAKQDLAHYAVACTDIEFQYPWGWGELEGVCNRGDYDLVQHEQFSNVKCAYIDQAMNRTYVPWVIESSAGLSRGVLAVLLDAYRERDGKPVLKLDPRLAPVLVHVLPVVGNKPDLVAYADKVGALVRQFHGTQDFSFLASRVHVRGSIGKRYQAADVHGVPICITVDHHSVARGSLWVRHRDSQVQIELPSSDLEMGLLDMLRNWPKLD